MVSSEQSKKDMNIILLMGLFPPQIRADIELNSKGAIQYAADALQWSFVRGFDLFSNVKIINLPFIGSYPLRYKKLNSDTFNFEHTERANDINVGFINLSVIKIFSRYINVKKELEKAAIQFSGEMTIVIYSVHSPFLYAAVEIKRKYPNTKICIIIPDLPQHMSGTKNIFYHLLKSLNSPFINRAMNRVDFFVLLSDSMVEALQIGCRPYVRIEGVYSSSDTSISEEVSKEKYKTILYSGSLARRYGIMNLVEAFCSIDKADYRLWICGEGDCRAEIENKAKIDDRIIYYGQISRSEVLVLQKRATVLVNPRTSEGEYTKFSFPSKVMEYMASGTPCIIHRLKGIPDEYFDYCFVSEREDKEGLRQMILEVCEKAPSELDEIGKRASSFIKEQKNPRVQVKKVYDMLKIETQSNSNQNLVSVHSF